MTALTIFTYNYSQEASKWENVKHFQQQVWDLWGGFGLFFHSPLQQVQEQQETAFMG